MFIPNNLFNKLEFDLLIKEFTKHCKLHSTIKKFHEFTIISNIEEYEYKKNNILKFRYKISDIFSINDYTIDNIDNILNSINKKDAYILENDLNIILSAFELFINLYSIDKDFLTNILHNKEINFDFIKKNSNYIKSILNTKGKIKDNATKKLHSIRKEKEQLENQQEKIINRVLKKYSELLMNDSITIVDERIVLQVKVQNKNSIKGILHSYSDTLKTAFIEPDEFVIYNNKLTDIILEEKEEIKNILRHIKDLLYNDISSINNLLFLIHEIDYINAVSKYMNEYSAIYPEISENILLKKAYNPVLKIIEKDKTIPIDIHIENNKSLLITGPNMGGKTVVLKTLGLFAVLTKMALPLICEQSSKMKLFDNIFIDIGDDQSIADGVSTFASHIINYKKFIDNIDNNTLILLDEIGTGTSVKEGSGFAKALIDYLLNKSAMIVFTSHFDILKEYAMKHNNIIYSSMLYDNKENKPLYILQYNTMGTSGVINLLKQYNFPKEIVNASIKSIGEDFINYADITNEYKMQLNKIKKEKQLLLDKKKAIEKIENILEKENKELKKKLKKIESEFIEKKEEELLEIRRQSELLIKNIKENNANKNSIKEFKNFINNKLKENENIQSKEHEIKENHLEIGDFVKLEGNIVGKIEEINGKDVKINVNGIILNTYIYKIIEKTHKTTDNDTINIDNSMHLTNTELDVRGMYVEDAIYALDNFIDKAKYSGLNEISIIHGHGTGKLKESIRNYLKRDKRIKSFASGLEKQRSGGDGITVIEL